jgi:hypothetical protein
MPDGPTIDVLIPVEARLADRLADPALRARAGEVVNAMLREAAVERLLAAMHALADEAERRGLTEELLEEELAAHKAERLAARTRPGG